MKSKSASSASSSSPRRATPAVAKSARNGNGNGRENGSAGGDGRRRSSESHPHVTPVADRVHQRQHVADNADQHELLEGQPSIAEFLTAPRVRTRSSRSDRDDSRDTRAGGLDKTTLLQALVAFRKGN